MKFSLTPASEKESYFKKLQCTGWAWWHMLRIPA
jgi:hypothetical protein